MLLPVQLRTAQLRRQTPASGIRFQYRQQEAANKVKQERERSPNQIPLSFLLNIFMELRNVFLITLTLSFTCRYNWLLSFHHFIDLINILVASAGKVDNNGLFFWQRLCELDSMRNCMCTFQCRNDAFCSGQFMERFQ